MQEHHLRLTDATRGQDAVGILEDGRITQHQSDLEDSACLCRQCVQQVVFFDSQGRRFFTEEIQTCTQTVPGDSGVRIVGGSDQNGVDIAPDSQHFGVGGKIILGEIRDSIQGMVLI